MNAQGITGRADFPDISLSQPNRTNNSNRSFSAEMSAAMPTLQESFPNGKNSFENMNQIDLAVQQDIKAAFGIEPHVPGTPLQPLAKSLWALQDLDSNGVISGKEIETNLQTSSDIFKKHLSSFLLNEKISAQPQIELSVAANGMIRVQDNHPEKEKIEGFINSSKELRNLFVGICNTKNFLEIGKESSRFQKRYAVDPRAAVAEFSHLFSGTYGYRTSLIINNEGWQYSSTPSFFV